MALTNIYKYLKRLSKRHLHGKLRNSTILEKNRKEKEEDIRKEQKGLLFYSSIKRVPSSLNKLVCSLICKSTSHMHMSKHWIKIKILGTL
jgi:hypothetical protein